MRQRKDESDANFKQRRAAYDDTRPNHDKKEPTMAIIELSVAELLPRITFDGVTRSRNDGAVTYLAESIKDIGLQHPIGVSRDADGTWQVVAGRHRVLACAQLGMEKIRMREFT